MGMYNEVHATHPGCGGRGTAQISQIVYGFGNFNLDNPKSIRTELALTSDADMVFAEAQKADFYCDKCGYSFKVKGCPCCNYPFCGHEHV